MTVTGPGLTEELSSERCGNTRSNSVIVNLLTVFGKLLLSVSFAEHFGKFLLRLLLLHYLIKAERK